MARTGGTEKKTPSMHSRDLFLVITPARNNNVTKQSTGHFTRAGRIQEFLGLESKHAFQKMSLSWDLKDK